MFYYLLKSMCLLKLLSEEEEGQAHACFVLLQFHGQAWKILKLLDSLILEQGGKICTAGNRLKCDGYIQCLDAKANGTFTSLHR